MKNFKSISSSLRQRVTWEYILESMCRTPTLTAAGLPEENGDTSTVRVPTDQRTEYQARNSLQRHLWIQCHGRVPVPPGPLYKHISRFWNSHGTEKNLQRPKQKNKAGGTAPVHGMTYYKAVVIKTVVQTSGSTNTPTEWNREPRNRPIHLVSCFPTNTSNPPNGKWKVSSTNDAPMTGHPYGKKDHNPCLTPHTRNNPRWATDPNTTWSYQTSEEKTLQLRDRQTLLRHQKQ